MAPSQRRRGWRRPGSGHPRAHPPASRWWRSIRPDARSPTPSLERPGARPGSAPGSAEGGAGAGHVQRHRPALRPQQPRPLLRAGSALAAPRGGAGRRAPRANRAGRGLRHRRSLGGLRPRGRRSGDRRGLHARDARSGPGEGGLPAPARRRRGAGVPPRRCHRARHPRPERRRRLHRVRTEERGPAGRGHRGVPPRAAAGRRAGDPGVRRAEQPRHPRRQRPLHPHHHAGHRHASGPGPLRRVQVPAAERGHLPGPGGPGPQAGISGFPRGAAGAALPGNLRGDGRRAPGGRVGYIRRPAGMPRHGPASCTP